MKTNMAFEKNHFMELAALELVDRISGYMDTGKISDFFIYRKLSIL